MEGFPPSICGRTIKQNYSYAAYSKNDADGNPIANSSASYAKDNLPTLYQISSTRYATYTYDSINRLNKRMLSTNRPIYNNYIYKLSDRNAASTTDTEDLYRTNQLLREIVDNTAYNYTYDVLGNITAIEKGTRTNTDTDDIATGSFAAYRSYAYDALSQLTRENNISTGLTTVWDYDVLGNIESATRYIYNPGTLSAPPMSRVDYIYGDGGTGWNHLLTELKHYQWQYSNGTLSPVLVDTESFAYDAIGNPTTYRDNTLTWDGRQLESYNGISYTYDADGITGSCVLDQYRQGYHLFPLHRRL